MILNSIMMWSEHHEFLMGDIIPYRITTWVKHHELYLYPH